MTDPDATYAVRFMETFDALMATLDDPGQRRMLIELDTIAADREAAAVERCRKLLALGCDPRWAAVTVESGDVEEKLGRPAFN